MIPVVGRRNMVRLDDARPDEAVEHDNKSIGRCVLLQREDGFCL